MFKKLNHQNLTFDNLDSPSSISLLFQYLEKIDATKPQVLRQTNSGQLGTGYCYDCTGHVGMLYFP